LTGCADVRLQPASPEQLRRALFLGLRTLADGTRWKWGGMRGLIECSLNLAFRAAERRRPTRHSLAWLVSMSVAASLALVSSGAVQASPLYPSCPVPGQDLAWFSWEFDPYCLCFKPAPVIHIYVESDMVSEMVDCNSALDPPPPYPPNKHGITQDDLLAVVDAAAETWNRGGRGAYLKVEGYLGIADEGAFCTASVQTPAVFLQFKKTCRNDDDSDTCVTKGIATTYGQPACGHKAYISIWGNKQKKDDPVRLCDVQPLNTPRLFNFGTGYTSNTPHIGFQEMLTHELGHILNIGDIDPAYSSNTLMNSGVKNGPDIGRKLYPFDRDCADENSGDRQVEYQWSEYNSYNNVWAGPYASGAWTRRGTVSGGHTRLNGNSAAWGLYTQNVDTGAAGLRWDTISYGYSAPWGPLSSSSGLYPGTVENLHLAPVLTSLQEFGTSGSHSSRMSYARYESAFTGGFEANINDMDPPRWTGTSAANSPRVTGTPC